MNRVRNVLLFLMVIACGVSFWAARRDADQADAGPTLPGPEEAAPPPVAAESIHVAVLNGTGEPGLARRVSRLLPALGCVVVEVGDAPADTFARTMLVNRRLDDERLGWLVRRLAGPVVIAEWDGRRDEDVVLVLGRDHRAKLPPTRGIR